MERQKKNGNKDRAIQAIVFVTAILNLIRVLVDLINRLLE